MKTIQIKRSILNSSDIFVKIVLTQNMDDMGIFNTYDGEHIEYSGDTIDEYIPYPDIGYVDKNVEDYFTQGDVVSGSTNSKKEFYMKYDVNNRYQEGFDVEQGVYVDPYNNVIDGKSRITEITNDTTKYVMDSNLSTTELIGIHYEDFNKLTRNIYFDDNSNTFNKVIKRTDFKFKSQGFNDTNIELKPIIKNEYLFGITESPKVENDIFIDRGNISVFDKHMKLGGIFSMQQLEQFGNGEFNIIN